MSEEEALSVEGTVYLIKAIFKMAESDLKRARQKGDYRTAWEVERFYKSDRCKLMVESAGGSYEAFLEVKGLK